MAAGPCAVAGAAEADTLESLEKRLDDVRAELDDLHDEADDAALEYRDSKSALKRARTAFRTADRRAEQAADRRAKAHKSAARHAVDSYKGTGVESMRTWVRPDGLTHTMARGTYISYLAERRESTLENAEAAQSAARTARKRADDARSERTQAVRDAAKAKKDADAAVDKQQDSMRDILDEQTRLERRVSKAAEAKAASTKDDGSGESPDGDTSDSPGSSTGDSPERASGDSAERDSDEAPSSEGPAGPQERADCADKATGGFGNGRVPEDRLCALPQSGERLRADAATAFFDLNDAYRKRFGRAMCVTDSYRPIDEQVRLFRELERGMAARPGTSTHGLGIAVDLCGGVQDHESAEHGWLLDNAGSYGWRNPEWARDGFEPWHWEYTG